MSEIKKEDYFNVGLKFEHKGTIYEVLEIGRDHHQVYLGWIGGNLWWTPDEISATLIYMPPSRDKEQATLSPVVRKIRSMEQRRKAMGYQW